MRRRPGKTSVRGLPEWALVLAVFVATAHMPALADEPFLSRIRIAPERRLLTPTRTARFSCEAIYSDGSTRDITNQVLWRSKTRFFESDNSAIATVDEGGLVTGVAIGTGVIEARYGATRTGVAIEVVPRAIESVHIVPDEAEGNVGHPIRFKARGTFNDGDVEDLTGEELVWTSTSSSVATIDPVSGTARGMTRGRAEIRARYQGKAGSASLTIQGAETPQTFFVDENGLESLTVTPRSATLEAGRRLQMKAVARYADGRTEDVTDLVSWTTDDSTAATVDAGGNVTGLSPAPNGAHVTASTGSFRSSARLSVYQAPRRMLLLMPDRAELAEGERLQLTAMLLLPNGRVEDATTRVRWRSSSPLFATVSNAGELTGISQGGLDAWANGQPKEARITATLDEETLPASLGMKLVAAIALDPNRRHRLNVAVNLSLQLTEASCPRVLRLALEQMASHIRSADAGCRASRGVATLSIDQDAYRSLQSQTIENALLGRYDAITRDLYRFMVGNRQCQAPPLPPRWRPNDDRCTGYTVQPQDIVNARGWPQLAIDGVARRNAWLKMTATPTVTIPPPRLPDPRRQVTPERLNLPSFTFQCDTPLRGIERQAQRMAALDAESAKLIEMLSTRQQVMTEATITEGAKAIMTLMVRLATVGSVHSDEVLGFREKFPTVRHLVWTTPKNTYWLIQGSSGLNPDAVGLAGGPFLAQAARRALVPAPPVDTAAVDPELAQRTDLPFGILLMSPNTRPAWGHNLDALLYPSYLVFPQTEVSPGWVPAPPSISEDQLSNRFNWNGTTYTADQINLGGITMPAYQTIPSFEVRVRPRCVADAPGTCGNVSAGTPGPGYIYTGRRFHLVKFFPPQISVATIVDSTAKADAVAIQLDQVASAETVRAYLSAVPFLGPAFTMGHSFRTGSWYDFSDGAFRLALDVGLATGIGAAAGATVTSGQKMVITVAQSVTAMSELTTTLHRLTTEGLTVRNGISLALTGLVLRNLKTAFKDFRFAPRPPQFALRALPTSGIPPGILAQVTENPEVVSVLRAMAQEARRLMGTPALWRLPENATRADMIAMLLKRVKAATALENLNELLRRLAAAGFF